MNDDSSAVPLKTYLRSLDKDQLDQVLKEVLEELRTRESDLIKKDVLRHSQLLRGQRLTA